MASIPLYAGRGKRRRPTGRVATVDAEDFTKASAFIWTEKASRGRVYAQTRQGLGRNGKLYLHRLICPAPGSPQVDHVNGDALDNRRENLRPCTHAQNGGNSQHRPLYRGRPTLSRFKGVSFDSRRHHWVAMIGVNRRVYNLGRFSSEEAAARAYDAAARLHFGEFARPNFPLAS